MREQQEGLLPHERLILVHHGDHPGVQARVRIDRVGKSVLYSAATADPTNPFVAVSGYVVGPQRDERHEAHEAAAIEVLDKLCPRGWTLDEGMPLLEWGDEGGECRIVVSIDRPVAIFASFTKPGRAWTALLGGRFPRTRADVAKYLMPKLEYFATYG